MEKGLNDNNIGPDNEIMDESCKSACKNSGDIDDLAGVIRDSFGLKKIDMRTYSPLALAFIGDSVYEIIIRSLVTEQSNRPANTLNKAKVHYVNAAAQAFIIDSIMDRLSEEEAAVYHRGRNAKSYTSAKNQSVIDYRKATGLEALCGYLYLAGRLDRVLELVQYGVKLLDSKDGK
jgi:ribonuclease-3 family protein